MSPKSIKNSTNVGKKLCLKTCLFLTLIFIDFRCILAPKLASKKVSFFDFFLKLAPEGSQEASKRLRKGPKRLPRPDFKRFWPSFWTVFGIVFGLGGIFQGSGIMARGQFQHAESRQHSVGICAGKPVGYAAVHGVGEGGRVARR